MQKSEELRDVNCFLKGNQSMYLENYRTILQFEETKIRIARKSGWIEIAGDRLCIGYYSNQEVEIYGVIKSIVFHE